MIKAAFFDIDGTLVSFKTHRMSDQTKKTLWALKEKGVKVFISSGRPVYFMNNLEDFPFDGYVAMNGALVLLGDGNVLYQQPLSNEDANKVVEISVKENIPTYVFMEKSFGINCMNKAAIDLQKMINTPMPEIIDIIDAARHNKVYMFTSFMTRQQEESLLHPVLGPCEYPRWHDTFMDIVPSGLSKADGAEILLKHFGLTREQSVAFGDGGNDIPIIEWAKIGVAMGNAEESVKACADYVTLPIDDEGLTYAVKQLGIL